MATLKLGGLAFDDAHASGLLRPAAEKFAGAWLACLRDPGGSSEALRNVSFARSISSSRSKSSALRSALDEFRTPSRPVDETLGIPFASPADFPPVLHPEGLRFPGVLLGWLAHSPHHTTSDPRKQEMRNSRNRENLRSSSACSSGRRSRLRRHAGGGYDDMGESEEPIFPSGNS